MTTWHVYQLRSATELLYVGHTRELPKRLSAHRCGKPWWPEVTDVHSEEFGSEDEARQCEKVIWASERPKYNKVSPFLTEEELHIRRREYEQRPERRARTRPPEYFLKKAEYMRKYGHPRRVAR